MSESDRESLTRTAAFRLTCMAEVERGEVDLPSNFPIFHPAQGMAVAR